MYISIIAVDGITASDKERGVGLALGKFLRIGMSSRVLVVDGTKFVAKRIGTNVVVLVMRTWTHVRASWHTIWTNSPEVWHYASRFPTNAAGILAAQGMFILLDPAQESEANGSIDNNLGLFGARLIYNPPPDIRYDNSFARFPLGTPSYTSKHNDIFNAPPIETIYQQQDYRSSIEYDSMGSSYTAVHSFDSPAIIKDSATLMGTIDNYMEYHIGELLIGRQAVLLYSTAVQHESAAQFGETATVSLQAPTPIGGYALIITRVRHDSASYGSQFDAEVVVIEKSIEGQWGCIFRDTIARNNYRENITWWRTSILMSIDKEIACVVFSIDTSTGARTYSAIKYTDNRTKCKIEPWGYMDAEMLVYANNILPGWYDSFPAYPSRMFVVNKGHLVWVKKVPMPVGAPIFFYWQVCDESDPSREALRRSMLGANYAICADIIVPSQWSDSTGDYENFRTVDFTRLDGSVVAGARWAFARYATSLTPPPSV